MYRIVYAEGVAEDLAGIRVYDRRAILDRVEEQLTHEPVVETRNKKRLPGIIPPWSPERVVWELRVGDYRVFYDVSEDDRTVSIRAIRKKPPHLTSEDIL